MNEHPAPEFEVSFRGYDKESVDRYISELIALNEQNTHELSQQLTDISEQATRSQQGAQAAQHQAQMLREQADEAQARAEQSEARVKRLAKEVELLDSQIRRVGQLPSGDEGAEGGEGGDESLPESVASTHSQFEEILRVAEEQANTVVANAAKQSQRLIEETQEQIRRQRADAQEDVNQILANARSDAEQARLTIETEQTAHRAKVEQQLGEISEKVSQAEREAAVVLAEGQRASASLRADAERESSQMREDAAHILAEARDQARELDVTNARKRDETQQEFLRLHNDAVAHAERITADANEKVASALQHAEHITQQAHTAEDLARAQSDQGLADARSRAQSIQDEARRTATTLVKKVRAHTTDALHEAEDRARSLRWQQQQIISFSAEVNSLLELREGRYGSAPGSGDLTGERASADDADQVGHSGEDLPEGSDVVHAAEGWTMAGDRDGSDPDAGADTDTGTAASESIVEGDDGLSPEPAPEQVTEWVTDQDTE
ncbi:MAG: hypothetical protein L0J79_04370, partial [Propionibacterium sp.]|nr:hypothetical protein [Propionibacterium sp.]